MDIFDKMNLLGQKMKMLEDRQLAFDFENRELNSEITELKEELKRHFLETKESARSQCLDVQYRKGAVKWETKWLDGFAIDHPEFNLGQYRKVGKPTVAFLLRDDDPWDEGM